jgi:hypothetical protein
VCEQWIRVPVAGGAGVASFPRLEINDIYVPLEDFFRSDIYIFRLFEFDQSDAISTLEITRFDLNVRIADTNQPAGYDLSTIVHSADPEEIIEVETGEDFFIEMACVRFAREQGLPVAVRGGGHNVSGSPVCDSGLVIDLLAMRSVRVDPSRKVVRVSFDLIIPINQSSKAMNS